MKIIALVSTILLIYILACMYFSLQNIYLVAYTMWLDDSSYRIGYVTLERNRIGSEEDLKIFIENVKHSVEGGDNCNSFIVNNICDLGRVGFF